MAAITGTNANVNGSFTVTTTALTASDTLVYDITKNPLLVLENTTGSLVTISINGSTNTSVAPDGYGSTISTTSGKTIAVAANATVAVKLNSIRAFLNGNVTVTGGTGVTASLYNN